MNYYFRLSGKKAFLFKLGDLEHKKEPAMLI